MSSTSMSPTSVPSQTATDAVEAIGDGAPADTGQVHRLLHHPAPYRGTAPDDARDGANRG